MAMSASDSESDDGSLPRKRVRREPPPPAPALSNGHARAHTGAGAAPHDAPSQPALLPPLSHSILGVEPVDEFIREIADFVHHYIVANADSLKGKVEVEAKIGVLRDKGSNQRLALPILVESVLAPNNVDVRFESNMSAMQHKHFNTLLNKLKVNPPPHSPSPIEYRHQYLVDAFYASDESPRDKIRVTRDEKNGTVQECMRKVRLGDLNVYSPKRAVDWRVSVNVEIPVAHPTGSATHTRRKDRITYTHEEFNIDLTQVTTTRGTQPPEIQHELEIEIARSELLVAAAARRGDPNVPEQERNAFDELIRAFVNNARILARNAGEGWQ